MVSSKTPPFWQTNGQERFCEESRGCRHVCELQQRSSWSLYRTPHVQSLNRPRKRKHCESAQKIYAAKRSIEGRKRRRKDMFRSLGRWLIAPTFIRHCRGLRLAQLLVRNPQLCLARLRYPARRLQKCGWSWRVQAARELYINSNPYIHSTTYCVIIKRIRTTSLLSWISTVSTSVVSTFDPLYTCVNVEEWDHGAGVPALQDELLRQAVPEATGECVRTPHVSRGPLANDAQ